MCMSRDWRAAGLSHINPWLVVVQPKKTSLDITEKVLNQIKQINRNFCQRDQCSDILLRLRSIQLIFLFLDRNICCGYSKEPSQWDSYLEHQCMFKQVDNILLSKNYLSKPACSGWTCDNRDTEWPFFYVCCKGSINRNMLAVIPFPVDFLSIYRWSPSRHITLTQHWFNVWGWINVDSMLSRRFVPARQISKCGSWISW